jgi:hypothetical protein
VGWRLALFCFVSISFSFFTIRKIVYLFVCLLVCVFLRQPKLNRDDPFHVVSHYCTECLPQLTLHFIFRNTAKIPVFRAAPS